MSLSDNFLRFNYSKDLHEYLKGMSLDCEGYTRQSTYQMVILIMLGLSTISTLNYYYGIFNRPSFSRRKTWILNVGSVASLVAFVGYTFASIGLPAGMHCSYLHFFQTDCILFGLTCFVYTVIYSLVLSTCVKWLSVNNKRVPF